MRDLKVGRSGKNGARKKNKKSYVLVVDFRTRAFALPSHHIDRTCDGSRCAARRVAENFPLDGQHAKQGMLN